MVYIIEQEDEKYEEDEGSVDDGRSEPGSEEDESEEGEGDEDEEGEGSEIGEEGSEEDEEEGGGVGEIGEEDEDYEEDEGSEERETGKGSGEDSEDERCEASGCFKLEKTFVPRSTTISKEGSEDDENERCEASFPCVRNGEQFLAHPICEELKEDEGNEEGSDEDEREGNEEDSEGDEGSEEREMGEGSEDDSEEDEGSEEREMGEGSEEDSEEDEGSEEREMGEGSEEDSEEDEGSEEHEMGEGSEEDDEDERCEAFRCFQWEEIYVRCSTTTSEKGSEDGEDERCEVSFPCVESGIQFVARPIREEYEEDEGSEEYSYVNESERSDEGSKEDSEGDEGSEEDSEGDEGSEEDSEGDEGSEEDSEDKRCEASRCFKWGKTFAPFSSTTSEESRKDGVEERCEASFPCVKSGTQLQACRIREEHEEDEGSEEGSDEDEGEGSEENGEDERCEASGCFKWGKTFIPHPISEHHEEDEGGEEDETVEGPEDEESDISDSEINEYKDAAYKLLKFRTYKIKGPNGQLRCPFCVGKERQEYNRLLGHAVRVAGGSTKSAKQRANHSAMAKYLVIDLANDVERLPPSANRILCNFTLEIDLRKKNMDQLQSKYEEKTMAVRKMLEEKDETHHTFFEEARNLLRIARDQSKRVLEQEEMLSFDFENKRRRLNSWSEDLNKREAALTNEKRKMDDLVKEKNDLDMLHHHHLAKECRPNDELLEVGKELMKGLEEMPSHCRVKIGVKRRWDEINEKSFMSACKKRHRLNEAETNAFELCCFWFKELRDDKGNPQSLLKGNEKLLGLKDKWGDKIYNAVVEVVEYNSNGNSMELWNFDEDRTATHCEVIRYIFSRWKTLQFKRDEIDEMIKTLF